MSRPESLVFLHGIGSVPAVWDDQIEKFGGLAPAVPLDLDRAVRELERLEPTALCGLSWGGLVALRYAVEHPERVTRLVLTAAFASLPAHLRVLQYTLQALVRVVPRAPHGMAGAMLEGARFDVRDGVRSLEIQTLVLCGERDRVNRPLCRKLASLLPNARFELVENAGHVANADNPETFNRLLGDFL